MSRGHRRWQRECVAHGGLEWQTLVDVQSSEDSPCSFRDAIQCRDGNSRAVMSAASIIFALVNTMLGSAMLTFPIQFKALGLVSSSLLLLVSALVSYVTCRIYLVHSAHSSETIEQTIRRIAGRAWQRAFQVVTGVYLLLLNVIYVDLVIDQSYSILAFACLKAGCAAQIADKHAAGVVFDRFSLQYMALLYLLPLFGLASLTNFSFMVRIAEFGMYPGFVYMVFILYQFGASVARLDLSRVVLFDWSAFSIAGTCALAFTVHTVVNALTQSVLSLSRRSTYLLASYVLGFLIYFLVGLFGALSVQDCPANATTVVDCYLDQWQTLFVEASYLLGRLAVIPCVVAISRSRLLETIYGQEPSEAGPAQEAFRGQLKRPTLLFNLGFSVFAVFVSMLSPYIPVSQIMNFVGAIVCFFFIYLVPVKIHLQCYYFNQLPSLKDSVLTEPEASPATSEHLLAKSPADSAQASQTPAEACPHPAHTSRWGKGSRLGGYLLIVGIGLVLAVYGLWTTIEFLIHGNTDSASSRASWLV